MAVRKNVHNRVSVPVLGVETILEFDSLAFVSTAYGRILCIKFHELLTLESVDRTVWRAFVTDL